jgi:hypothetical protein
MLIRDLRKAIREGKLVDITGVKLRSWGTDNQLPAVLHISFDTPSAENKPVCDNLDIAEVSLSTKQKYDPCRLLRKGDKVQVKKRDGRCNGKAGEYLREAFCTVVEDETQNELVRVLHNATEYRLDPAYLELVTPVEEPFNIYKSDDNEYVILFEDTRVSTFPFKGDGYPYYYTQEQAKARADQERDRLNDEWRKRVGK